MSESLSQTVARLTSFIKANAPDVDISPGSVFSELVLNLESQVQNQVFSDISDITAANSIQKALTSLTDTYNPVIDEIASNYNTYRNQGTKSSGVIKIYVAVSANYTIPANVVFTQPNLGYTYITTTSTSVGPSTPTPTLFAENNLYYFFVSVQAQNIGQMTVISDGTQFIMSPGSQPTRFVKALAFGAFSAGLNTETDKQLIARFRNGLGSNNLLSQNSIINKFDTLYANFQDAYLADNTSALNNSSISTTLGFKVPGCVDVWVKDGVSIPNVVFTITDATYSSETDSWSITIPSSVAPGFYRVAHVEDANAT